MNGLVCTYIFACSMENEHMVRNGHHLNDETHTITNLIRRKAKKWMKETNDENREMAGLILIGGSWIFFFREVPRLRTSGTPSGIRFQWFTQGGTATSIPPHCGGARERKYRVPGRRAHEVLLGEYHTHPSVFGCDIAPPSAADLYQLLLACYKSEHNLAYVVARLLYSVGVGLHIRRVKLFPMRKKI